MSIDTISTHPAFRISAPPVTVDQPPSHPHGQGALADAVADAQANSRGSRASNTRLGAAIRLAGRNLAECFSGQQAADAECIAMRYLESGIVPDGLALAHPAPPSRIDRVVALLESCQAALGGPMEVAVRTGLITLATLMIREAVTFYTQQALDSHDVSTANRAWASAGVFLVGPCLNVIGALRDEVQLCANTRTRLGRVAMLGLCMGAGIAQGLHGNAHQMLPGTVGTLVYSMVRDVSSAFFPVATSVRDYSLVPVTAAAGLYGAMGGLFETLASHVPHFEGDLGYGLFNHLASAWPGMASILAYSVLDDLALPAMNHPTGGAEPVPFTLAVNPRWAAAGDVATAITTNGALRASAINVINALYAVAVAQLISTADDDGSGLRNDLNRGLILAATFVLIYLPFVYATLRSAPPAPALDDQWQSTRL